MPAGVGYTLEQLQKMGAKPTSYSFEDLQGLGAKPISTTPSPPTPARKKTGGERLRNTLGDIFGGQTIGEAIGTQVGKLSKGAKQLKETERGGLVPKGTYAETFKGPSAGRVAGDVVATGLSLAGIKGANLLTKGGRLASAAKQTALGAGIGGARGAEAGQSVGEGATQGAAFGAAFPLAGAGLRTLGRFARGTGAGLAGQKTSVLSTIAQNPKAARAGLRGESRNLLMGEAKDVGKQVKNLRRTANSEFGKALETLPKRLGRSPKVAIPAKRVSINIGGEKTTLSTLGVKQKLTRELRKFGVEVDPKALGSKSRFDFLEAPLDKAEQGRLREIFETITDWKDATPKGLHRLARKISSFRRPGQQSAELNNIVDAVSRNVRDYIGDRVPAFRPIIEKYKTAIGGVEALEKGLGVKRGKPLSPVQIDSIQNKIRGIFSGGADEILRPRIEALPGGQNLVAQEAGRRVAANEFSGGGIGASIWELIRAGTSSVITPRAIGEIAATIGQTQQATASLLKALKPLGDDAKIKIIRSLVSDFD